MILAVHISDAILRPEWWSTGWVVAVQLAALGLYRLKPEELPRLAMVTAVFFMASSVHIPIGVGRVHLLLTALVGTIAGPHSGLVVMAGLTLQNRLVGHGGLLSLGFNTVAMTLPALLIGWMFRWLNPNRTRTPRWLGWFGVITGGLGVMMTVGLSYLGLYWGSMPEWQSVTWMFLVAHIPVVVAEAILTGFLLHHLGRSGYSFCQSTGMTSSSGTSH